VSRSASEKEVKQAHRRLVKQHHPDVRKGEDLVAQAQFLRIQEAYELIMGKRAGKDVDGRPTEKSSWDFHDWFWSFKMKRKQGVREQAATFRSQWQAQMTGLKQKAAAKRWKQGRRRPAAAADSAADSAPAAAAAGAGPAAAGAAAAGPASSSAARERVWRSMTKNARNADKAAAERAAAQQTLGATGRSAQQAVGAGSQQQQEQAQEVPLQQTQRPQHAAASAQHTQQHTATDEAASHSSNHSSSGSSSSHAARLRELMEHAAALVQGRRPGAGAHAATAHAASDAHAAHAAHAQPEAAGHEAPGRHWRGRMTLDQLASLLGGGSAGNAVPADEQLHRRFEAARRAQQGQHGSMAAGHAAVTGDQPEAAAAEEESQAEAEPQHAHQQHHQQYEHQQQHHYGGAHARKFANHGDVEERLSSQLAGLKRRAALKQEVQSSC
jgi:curved DNA-binding protein CbpA